MQFYRACAFFLAIACASSAVSGQEESGRASQPSASWTMLSVHRVWTPQFNGYPNGGFGIQTFVGLGSSRNPWLGFSVLGTGLEKRDALAINFGIGTWFIGDARLGAFCFAMSGLGVTSGSGLARFNFLSDPTTRYGLASQGGVGGAIEVFSNMKIHLSMFGMWFTTDRGPTPIGLQGGLTFGGK